MYIRWIKIQTSHAGKPARVHEVQISHCGAPSNRREISFVEITKWRTFLATQSSLDHFRNVAALLNRRLRDAG